MKAQYLVKCQACSEENPLFQHVCRSCGTTIRDRVPSLDLGKVILLFIESPTDAFARVIQSEQKNYYLFILLTAFTKIYLTALVVSNLWENNQATFILFLLHFGIVATFYFFISLLVKLKKKKRLIKVRIRDLMAGLSYALFPQTLGLVFIFSLEFVVFGEQIFTFNPSPFIIKIGFAYLFLVIEVAVLLWTLILGAKFMRLYFENIITAIVIGTSVIGLVYLSAINFL